MKSYEKIIFVWNEPQPLIVTPERLSYRPVTPSTTHLLTEAVAQVMASSRDRHDQKMVGELDAAEAAARFLAEANTYFGYQLDWWQLAYDYNEELVGFLLPVIYPGADKAGLEEATIYYIGVLPTHRGFNYGYDLLCRATQTLQQFGVWRIFCDTDETNEPMIRTFRRVGYKEAGRNMILLDDADDELV